MATENLNLELQTNEDFVDIETSADNFQKIDDAFGEHTGDTNNPHSVTKAQVGLGNVENYAVNDMPATYTEASTLANISSGERLAVAFGKIKKAISSLIGHIDNKNNPHSVSTSQIGAATTGQLSAHTGNTDNPHSVTRAQIGAAAESHNHSASEVTSGTLPASRGGTGVTSIGDLKIALGKKIVSVQKGGKLVIAEVPVDKRSFSFVTTKRTNDGSISHFMGTSNNVYYNSIFSTKTDGKDPDLKIIKCDGMTESQLSISMTNKQYSYAFGTSTEYVMFEFSNSSKSMEITVINLGSSGLIGFIYDSTGKLTDSFSI